MSLSLADQLTAVEAAYLKTLEALQAGDGDQFILRNRLKDLSAELASVRRQVGLSSGSGAYGPKINVGGLVHD
jgi:hypothetical protein